jgi:saccharopine dehydrogenase-like NADP-dependent oxidoreductase
VRVLLLGGAGTFGRRTAAELLRREEVTALTVAARRRDSAARVAQLLGRPDGQVAALGLDVADAHTLLVSAARDHDVVASCAGPAHRVELPAIRASIEAGTPYVSLCDDHAATVDSLALDGEAKAAGVTIVSGCGLSPGITNVLTAYAALSLDRVEEMEIAVAYSLNDSHGDSTMLHLLRELARDAPYVSEFRPAQGRAGDLPRPIYFPEPVGWVETFTCGHPEPVTAPRVYPELRASRFRAGLTERAAMDALRAVAASPLRRAGGDHFATRLALTSVNVLRSLPPRGAAWTAARVDVWGETDGRAEVVSLGVVDHIANLASVPLTHAAVELGKRVVDRPGVNTVDDVFEPARFLEALARRGLRAARLTPEIFEAR